MRPFTEPRLHEMIQSVDRRFEHQFEWDPVLKVSKADLLKKEARLERANDKRRAIKT
jgi:hypothetical protein